jgi:branched-chain amino acid aminotransferase
MKYQLINGRLLPKEKALIPLNDLGLLRSYSVFDFFRVLSGVAIFVDDHIDRLLRSASKMQIDLQWSGDEIKSMCEALIESNNVTDAGLRIIATGGYSEDGYTPSHANIFMTLHKLPEYSPQDFTHGRKLIASNFTRDLPEVKTTVYVHAIQHQQRMKDANAIEILYHTDGVITECSRSNIFFVDQDDVLVTPSDAILQGISRKRVLNIAKENYTVVQRTVKMEEIARMKEAFLTSSTKGVLPVIEIEDDVIGNGKVGDISTELHHSFNNHINEYIKLNPASWNNALQG